MIPGRELLDLAEQANGREVRSSATLDSPQTMRSGCSAASRPLALNSAVSASEALTRWVGFCTLPGWTRAIVTDRTAGNGAVRANASGPEPAAAANAAMPSAPRATAAGRRVRLCDAVAAVVVAV